MDLFCGTVCHLLCTVTVYRRTLRVRTVTECIFLYSVTDEQHPAQLRCLVILPTSASVLVTYLERLDSDVDVGDN